MMYIWVHAITWSPAGLFLWGVLQFLPLWTTQHTADLPQLQVSWKGYEKKTPDCGTGEGSCAQVRIQYPEVNLPDAYVQHLVNQQIQRHITRRLGALHHTFRSEASIPTHIDAIFEEYREARQLFPDLKEAWDIELKVEVVFSHPEVLSLAFRSHVFQGGAHGNEAYELLTLDLNRGTSVGLPDLVFDGPGFRRLAEHAFRRSRGLAPDEPLSTSGLLFPRGEFFLPKQVALTSDGLLFVYQPYELGPYAAGTIQFILPTPHLQTVLQARWARFFSTE